MRPSNRIAKKKETQLFSCLSTYSLLFNRDLFKCNQICKFEDPLFDNRVVGAIIKRPITTRCRNLNVLFIYFLGKIDMKTR